MATRVKTEDTIQTTPKLLTMLISKRIRKAIAATFLALLVTNLCAPTITYAVTSGPTQPEATSFEPVDTTDMVNLQTGDFTYNIPLLEIPGPEGGYPLSLSYHAGIQPDEDASWVGLGWTLNPGAINRTVNGYPDDWKAKNSSVHSYWAGGTTTTYNVGASVGIANCATIGVGLAFSSDTYRGFGVGFDVSAGLGKKIGDVKAQAFIGAGVSPYGDSYIFGGAGLGLGTSANASVGVSFTTNFQSFNVGVSASALGVSISSSGGKSSLSIGGFTSSVSNSKANDISTASVGWNFNVDIPVWYGINLSLGHNKQRYWTNETANVQTNGSLFYNNDGISGTANNLANDEYSLLEDPQYRSILDNADPKVVQGGSFFDYDVYSVNAQGLAGNMRPFIYQGSVWNQNIYNGSTPLVHYYVPNGANGTPQFRFENDFSNRYTQNYLPYPYPGNVLNQHPFDASPIRGFNDGQGNDDGSFGYGDLKNALAGSKQINITPTVTARHALGYNMTDRHTGYEIPGFTIINESGMAYHFALPAYEYNEESYQEPVSQAGGASGNRLTKGSAYAYTWYLTSITGPDFMDRNSNGLADDGDWGYWVDFEYGKWNNRYNWRNPSEGYHRDEDNVWQNCSMGTREVYYLNAVRTRTHVALFEKEIRNDAKGSSPESYYKTTVSGIGDAGYSNQGLFNTNSGQSLKLSKIYLLNAADENIVPANSSGSGTYKPTASRSVSCTDCELANNILDKSDVDASGRFALEAKALRIIDFSQDYSLCQNTVNSYDINYPSYKYGKLTLLSVVNRGKGGVNLMPPIIFGYDKDVSENVSQANVSLTSGSFATSNGNFKLGDLIYSSSHSIYCGVITAKNVSGGNYVYALSNGNYQGSATTANVTTTKNPPYNKNAYDSWGLYKSNFSTSLIAANENQGRVTDGTSGSAADAWSLRSVTSQLGGKINISYESDQISSVGVSFAYPYIINSPEMDGAFDKIRFGINSSGYALSDIVAVNDINDIVFETKYSNPGDHGPAFIWRTFSRKYTITAIDIDGTVHATLDSPIPYVGNGYTYSSCTSGNISCRQNLVYGGGIRVNSLKIANSDGSYYATSYNYNNPYTGFSSGATSYLPNILDVYDDLNIHSANAFKAVLYKDVNLLYSIAREIPPPSVMYEYVTVTNQVKNVDELNARNLEGKIRYQFETFRKNMAGISDVTPRTGPVLDPGYGDSFTRNLVLQKFTGSIGNLKSTTRFDNSNPGKKISETIVHYLHDGLEQLPLTDFMNQYKARLAKYYYQGFLQERIEEVKKVENQLNTADNGIKATCSARESYPCIKTGETTINYINGAQTSSNILGFDFYSGAVTSSVATDAYGNNVLTETVPAYRIYPGTPSAPGMGFAFTANSYAGANRNMLTQTAAQSVWRVDESFNKIGLISSNVTIWNNTMPALGVDGTSYSLSIGFIWRPQSTYKWMPFNQTADGTTAAANFSNFNFSSPSSSNANWKNTSNVTLYDVYSKALEGNDINGNYVATKLNFGDSKVILSGGPAKFYEIAYSGGEDAAVSQSNNMFVKAGDGTVATAAFHTGTKSILIGTSGKKGFIYSVVTGNLTEGRNYQASIWVKPQSGSGPNVKLQYDINGTVKNIASVVSSKSANGWYLMNLPISGSDIVNGTTLNVYCINNDATVLTYADDFRFQPLNATTSAYVYDPFSGELTYSLDNSNLYTKFTYDAIGKLNGVYTEKLGTGVYKKGDVIYNYSTAKFSNTSIQNQIYTRNNCPIGFQAGTATVSVPAGTYNSFVSQIEADAIASAYAQDYANTHSSCTQLAAISCNNNANVSGFVALYTNLSNGLTYNFSIPAGGGALGYIPVGTYSLKISKSGNNSTYTFDAGCGGTPNYSGTSGNFNPISVTTINCKTILISYPL